MNKFSDFFRKTDVVLWLLTLSAVVYSLFLISSMQRAGNYSFLRPQIAAAIAGFAAAILFSFADYRFFIKKWAGLPHPNRLYNPRLASGAGTKFRGLLCGLPRGVVLRTLKAIASDNVHRHNWYSPFLIL